MIQFNLLPDVKVEYLKAERTRKVITAVSLAVTVAALVFLALIFSIHVYKTKHLASLTKEIDTASAQLKSQKDIDRKLTVQNQLKSITSLHDGKPAATRLFNYLNQITPDKGLSITNLKVDFATSVISITGTADSLVPVNKYVDTIKFTKYKVGKEDPVRAFNAVVMSKFTYATPDSQTGNAPTDQPATYIIDLTYDPAIFDITKDVQLQVPTLTTTRSSVNSQSADLFRPEPVNKETNIRGGNL